MSKKSRKRNKKILAALALAGGAAMLGRGKGEISSNRPSGIDAALVASKAKDLAAPVVDTGSDFQTKYKRKVNGNWITPGTSGVMDRVTGVDHPILTQARIPPGSMRRFKGGGIAKRGMGAAYKSGGRVKSMGIAKRGGGIAKR